MIPVTDESGGIVAQVKYTANLDYWDGRNWTCGSTGRHKGLTKLKDGRFVLIHGTQWQNERDTAEIISPEQAVQEILAAGADELFGEFPELAALRDETIVTEAE